jgi:Ca2+-binding EF-hand superfamily protein
VVSLVTKDYIRQQAHRTFHALDADGNGYIEQREFCMVVEATRWPHGWDDGR